MKLINLNSKRGIVNLFADFIIKEINPKYNSIIQVTDLNYFFIVNGITESKEILDLSKIKDKFISEYQHILKTNGITDNFNIMDLIMYDKKIINSEDRELSINYYNSSRPIYNPNIINSIEENTLSVDFTHSPQFEINYNSVNNYNNFVFSELQISSSFPHGYSLKMGRSLLYYGEYIVYNIFNTIFTDEISFNITNKKDNNGYPIFKIHCESIFETSTIESLISDDFDFDFDKFEKSLVNYDFCDDIKKPTEVKPWLVKDINYKDLIIM
jgi:hypothetical protein